AGADTAAIAFEQRQSQLLLKQPQLAADRTVGDVQLGGGQTDAAQPRGGFESAQGVERGQGMVAHGAYLTAMGGGNAGFAGAKTGLAPPLGRLCRGKQLSCCFFM